MYNDMSIGIFDSGLGGIGVLKLAREMLPHENFIYYGDNKNSPYGTKSPEKILELTKNSVEFLTDKKVKVIVIACNTATSIAVEQLRTTLDIPVISMEPAVKVGLKYRNNGKVVVLATPATVSQKRYKDLITRLSLPSNVISIACEGLSEMIEELSFDDERIYSYIFNKLSGYKLENLDSLVLGCTHYVFIKDVVIKALNDLNIYIPVVDGNMGTVKHLKKVLDNFGILNQNKDEGKIQIYTSKQDKNLLASFEKALYG